MPENITPLVNGEGLILSDENMNYQMLVDIRSYSFDLKKETPDFFAQDEELLTQVADILATAQKTDLPNTTMDDIVEENAKNSDSVNSMDEFTEKVDTVDLVIEENKFTVSVPEDFYMIKEDEPSETTKLFTSAAGETNVSLYLVENISGEKIIKL